MMLKEITVLALNAKAESLRQLGQKQQAKVKFQEALAVVQKGGISPNTEASVCTNYGLLLLSEGNLDQGA